MHTVRLRICTYKEPHEQQRKPKVERIILEGLEVVHR